MDALYSLLKNIYIYGYAISIVTSTDLYANCGNNTNFTDLSGKIIFPAIGNKYSNNVECRWLINVAPNILRVDINNIDLENELYCRYDYVAFYDDPNYQHETRRYCSNKYIATFHESGVLYIKVVTDKLFVRSGFNLTWKSIIKDCYNKNCYSSDYCNVVSGNAVCSCPYGYYLQSDNRTCVDPCDYNNCYLSHYCNRVLGKAVCYCPLGYYLQTDNRTCYNTNDLCNIKNCYSSDYCNIVSGNAVCSCPFGYYLHSDNRTCISLNYNCGNNTSFTDLSGKISFPAIGNKYSNNVQCRWLINVATNILRVDITNIDLECDYHYVAFYDDPNYQNEISRYCSNEYVVIFLESGVLYIKVVTYYGVVKSGFNLMWSSIAKAPGQLCNNENCFSSSYCNVVSGNAVCLCPNKYVLQSDNRTCSIDPCYNNNCYLSYYCNRVSAKAVCYCPLGYYLQTDNRTCYNSNDLCNIENCYSSDYCNVVSGNAVCSCPFGYYLQSDNRTCINPCSKCYSSDYCSVVSGKGVCSCPNGYYLDSDNSTCLDSNNVCKIKKCYSSSYCNVVSGNAVCSCPYGYYLQSDNRTCIDLCYINNCYSLSYCNVESGRAVCLCPKGYYLREDGKSCLYGENPCHQKGCYNLSYCKIVFDRYAECSCPQGYYMFSDGRSCATGPQLSGASIVVTGFGIIFCLFLFAFCAISCKHNKGKFEPITVRFNAETQALVEQGLTENQFSNVDIQIRLNNTDYSISRPLYEIGLDNTAHFDVSPPPYEPIPLLVSVVLHNESPPDYSN